MSPPGTEWRDNFSLPGNNDVTSHVDFDSSRDTKIAPRAIRMATGVEVGVAVMCSHPLEWL